MSDTLIVVTILFCLYLPQEKRNIMVIKTILDTDLYKFTTSYAYIKLFPYAIGTFTFKDRDETEYTEGFLKPLKNEIII